MLRTHNVPPNRHSSSTSSSEVYELARRPLRTPRRRRPPTIAGRRFPRCSAEAARRVFVVSDLHTDHPENMAWVRRLPRGRHGTDALVVAGDVAETHAAFVRTMAELRERFGSVFFVPGNHDLWCRREDGRFMDSLEKLTAMLDACNELGVETKPQSINGMGIIPLYSWYHKSFDKEKDIPGIRIPPIEMACTDFHACKWPAELTNSDIALALYFDQLNDNNNDAIEEVMLSSSHVITFSHFVPRQELCPEKRMLFYPKLPKIIGSDFLERRLRSIHQKANGRLMCHIFGHTHFCWDSVIDKIRYVQAPLGYPKERKRLIRSGDDWIPFCIYSNGFTGKLSSAYWSKYYAENPRDPDNVDAARWVADFYHRRKL